jgi:ATP-dependent exoDNAse (exonuclease V) beta subunit
VGPRELLEPDRSGARARGSVVHRWLETVEWLEELSLDEDALLAEGRRTARALGADQAAVDGWLDDFRRMLGRPGIAALLSRESCVLPGSLEVWRERRFALQAPDEEGRAALLHGSFDRVVLAREDGRVVGAELIDFKTDAVPDEQALQARVAHHRPQMKAYREALATLTGLAPADIRCRLAFLERGRVEDPSEG